MKLIIKYLMNIPKYIYNLIYVNRRIKRDTYVHLMFNSNLNYDVVDFFNRTSDDFNHLYICKFWFPTHKFPIGENVIRVNTYKFLNLKKAKKVFCHSFFDTQIISMLYKNDAVLKKSYWIVWGGDLYEAPDNEKDNYVRQNVRNVVTLWDKNMVIKKYGNNSIFYSAMVPSVTNEDELISRLIPQKKDGRVYIQINNSAHKSTIDMLNILAKFKNENICIRTIVSYGDLEYIEEIQAVGTNIFGEKFEVLKSHLSREEYLNYLNQNDILVMYQDRQQGLGNILTSLRLGKKVFLKGTISPFNVFHDNQIDVFDSDEIKNLSFQNFISNSVGSDNKKRVYERFLDEKIIEKDWNYIFSN